jgi:GTP-binding protein Era
VTEEPRSEPFRVGFVSVVGRPNVGKSTLVNRLVGQKIAIVSDKPQTTRNRILAVANVCGGQIVLFDTPGLHKPRSRMNERMVDAAVRSLRQVDVVLWLVDATEKTSPGDQHVQRLLTSARRTVVLGLNKIDLLPKPRILPAIDRFRTLMDFADIVPFSALTGENVDRLVAVALSHLPAGAPLYPEDFVTDEPERVIVGELVREQVLRQTRDEIPYATGVVVESFKEDPPLVRIEASVFVEKASQKGILIGKGGARLKAIGTAARAEIEAFLGTKVFLGLFVKVRENWREDPSTLESMGLGARGRSA